MKYNEFGALQEILEIEGITLNEMVGAINEAGENNEKTPDQIETSKSAGGSGIKKLFRSPKFARARTKLENNAKKIVKFGKEKLVTKYLPTILKSVESITKQVEAYSAGGKTPEEIFKLISKEAKNLQGTQANASANIEKAIDKVEATIQKRVDTLINESSLKDKNKQVLELYWVLLNTQAKQLIFKSIVKAREDFIQKAFENNDELTAIIDKVLKGDNFNVKYAELGNKAKQEMAAVKKAGESTDTPNTETTYEVGKKYEYTNPKNNKKFTIKVLEVKDDGSLQIIKDGTNGSGYPISKDKLKERMGKEIKDSSTTEEK